MKRGKIANWTAALILALALLTAAVPPLPALASGGECGSAVTWTLQNGILTISGEGAMYGYADETEVPWYAERGSITQLVVTEGVTSVGSRALYGCTSLVRAVLPDSVEKIGQMAFMNCENLIFLTIGGGLTSIGSAAFRACSSLNAVKLPEGLQTIGSEAFYRCSALTSIELPASVTSLGISAFAYCTGLIRAVVASEISALPDWTFYGCTSLSGVTLANTITSAGDSAFYGCENLKTLRCSAEAKQTLAAAAREGSPDLWDGNVSGNYGESVSASLSATETVGDLTSSTVITASETAAATLTTTLNYAYNAESGYTEMSGTVSAILENDSGWDDVFAELERVQSVRSAYTDDENAAAIDTEIALKGEPTVSAETLTALEAAAGEITIITNNGFRWLLAESAVIPDGAEALNLGAELAACGDIPNKISENMETGDCYALTLEGGISSRIQLTLTLPAELAGQTAGFFNNSSLLQSAYIADSGAATFSLSGLEAGQTYYIGMNPTETESAEVRISEETAVQSGLGSVEYIDSNTQYVVTGITTPLGLSGVQVGLILLAVLAACAAVVGAVLFTLNKRRLRRGYVPDIDMDDLTDYERRD